MAKKRKINKELEAELDAVGRIIFISSSIYLCKEESRKIAKALFDKFHITKK